MKNINIGSIARANAKSIANQLTVVVNGMGESKREARATSGMTGQNGQNKSDKVHSPKAMDNFRSVAKNYFQHVKDSQGGRIEKNINVETAKDFIVTKLNQGLEGSSANTYISVLEKVAEGLEKMTNKTYISKNEFKSMKNEVKEQWDLKKVHRDRSFDNPLAIQKEMERFSEHTLSTKLQIELGLRVDDAINSRKWTVNENNTLTISRSKGGITYQTAPLSKDLQKEVIQAIKHDFKISETAYTDNLKEAVRTAGEVWEKHSSHGLRYNFAQVRLQALIKEGKTFTEADAQVSLEMGHSRTSITDTYTKFTT